MYVFDRFACACVCTKVVVCRGTMYVQNLTSPRRVTCIESPVGRRGDGSEWGLGATILCTPMRNENGLKFRNSTRTFDEQKKKTPPLINTKSYRTRISLRCANRSINTWRLCALYDTRKGDGFGNGGVP